MDNQKVIVKDTGKIGKGLYANEDIKKGEIIADWKGGKIYEAEKCSKLPQPIRDYAIQFEEHKWIDTNGIGHFFNHSCEPNCGIKGKFQIVAMRDINKGEWLTYDYEMTEDSDWTMKCECGSKSCRKIIGAFKNMPNNLRVKYKGYISDWLIKKYKI
jgi:uncharacterized protein